MTPAPDNSHATRHAISELRMIGDWACAHGDFSVLRQVARRLTGCLPERVHGDLGELAESCLGDPERAAVLWQRLRTGALRPRES